MPYYCTVPRCTSMAGKAKNVSFHQFPRDEELAKLWNEILKRGKPYTKYSKVCSLHFRPEDYTITSVGKNKGQWRTLRKDAVPSRNLPSESPGPHKSHNSSWQSNNVPSLMDPRCRPIKAKDLEIDSDDDIGNFIYFSQNNPASDKGKLNTGQGLEIDDDHNECAASDMQHQMAQAIYMQTMLAMQATSNGSQISQIPETKPPTASTLTISDIEQLIIKRTYQQTDRKDIIQENQERQNFIQETTSYKCLDCSKCFKDPDVFILHRRSHKQEQHIPLTEKENYNSNSESKQETLKANPILANLLKSGISNEMAVSNGTFDANNILSIENQIMAALAANMESYIRNLSTMLSNQAMESPSSGQNSDQDGQNYDHNSADGQSSEDQNSEGHQEPEGHNYDFKIHEHDKVGPSYNPESPNKNQYGHSYDREIQNHDQETQNFEHDVQNYNKEGSNEPSCDNEDLNESKDSNSLVIDENV